jgi:glyoxylase-like metal-dependent hydrolase (beta-lactamase superfamily II)
MEVGQAALPEGVTCVLAPNPGPMTYRGTNTYLIEDGQGGVTVLDPGPAIDAHVDAVVAAGAGRIRRILISHTHPDHVGAALALQARTGAPTLGWHRSADPGFTADQPLQDGAAVGGLTALYTPGHAADHLCFEWHDGIVFTADHVMGWSTSVVSPPDGDMGDYFASLRRLLARPHRLYLCGHGPVVPNPRQYVRALLAHRIHRERAIGQALAEGAMGTAALVKVLYKSIDARLHGAAERNVLAHLLKLEGEAKVERRGADWHWIGGVAPHGR